MKKNFLLMLVNLLFVISTFAQGYQVGDQVKDFSLKNIDGTKKSLSEMKAAKGFIVVFTCNSCPYAKAYEQRIMDLNKKYQPKGYPVIAINPNDPVRKPEDSFDSMQKRAKEIGYDFPYLFDETQQVAKAFGATKTPHVYLLEKKSDKMVVQYIGAIDDNTEDANKVEEPYVGNAIDALLAGKPVKKKETKAIGCTIKWKKA